MSPADTLGSPVTRQLEVYEESWLRDHAALRECWTCEDAIAVGANIMWTGSELIRRSFDGLMDHALPPGDRERIRSVIHSNLPPGATFHALRTPSLYSRDSRPAQRSRRHKDLD